MIPPSLSEEIVLRGYTFHCAGVQVARGQYRSVVVVVARDPSNPPMVRQGFVDFPSAVDARAEALGEAKAWSAAMGLVA